MSFGDRLRERREAMGWTQEDLARRIGVDRTVISAYEARGKIPRQERLNAICDALNTSIDYLMERTDNPEPHPMSRSAEQERISISPEEQEILEELKKEAAFYDFLGADEERKRQIIEGMKYLIRIGVVPRKRRPRIPPEFRRD
ncbi:MAG: helix-turn-helix domain-containing protein [Alicyclobacillus sp.]|nr:helix-turn-helix domain-containing protein [Alicyclobacillus sp.]